MKKLKIAFVVNNFPAVSEPFIFNRIIAFIDKGHDVTIFSYENAMGDIRHSLVEEYQLLKKCHYYQMSVFRRFLITSIVFIEKTLRKSKIISSKITDQLYEKRFAWRYNPKQWFAGRHFDAIHVHYGFNAVPLVHYKAKGYLKETKIAVTFHGCDIVPAMLPRLKTAYAMIFEHVDAITVNSQYMKDLVASISGLGKNIHILPSGIRPEKFKRDPKFKSVKSESIFRVLFIGRLIDWKGLDLAVDIINELVNIRGHSQIEFRIVGSGDMRSMLSEQIQKLQLNKHIFFLGSLSQEDIIQELHDTDVLLLPGIHHPVTGRAETQGGVIQEAQSMQVPAIVSDAGGMKYGLQDGKTGFVVKQYDIKGFADKIELLMHNTKLCREMGEAGRAFIKKHFDSYDVADRLIEIYQA